MSKKKKPQVAQQLIESLLDAPPEAAENTDGNSSEENSSPNFGRKELDPEEQEGVDEESFYKSVVFDVDVAKSRSTPDASVLERGPATSDKTAKGLRPAAKPAAPAEKAFTPPTVSLVTNNPSSDNPSSDDSDQNEKTISQKAIQVESPVPVAPRKTSAAPPRTARREQTQDLPPPPRESVVDKTAVLQSKPDKPERIPTRADDTQNPVTERLRKSTPPENTRSGTNVRYGADKMVERRVTSSSSGAVLTSAEATLKQSESLRIAQSRISELEGELELFRRENERLATAGETLRRRSDELLAKTEALESQGREAEKILTEEKKVLRAGMIAKERDLGELRQRLEEMESRLESNFKKIRVRERELEHRLEIVKMENATVLNTKDKMILELKRQIDQLSHEAEFSKSKSQELYGQYRDKQDTIRRVVRALRIALTILEGDEQAPPLKKAE